MINKEIQQQQTWTSIKKVDLTIPIDISQSSSSKVPEIFKFGNTASSHDTQVKHVSQINLDAVTHDSKRDVFLPVLQNPATVTVTPSTRIKGYGNLQRSDSNEHNLSRVVTVAGKIPKTNCIPTQVDTKLTLRGANKRKSKDSRQKNLVTTPATVTPAITPPDLGQATNQMNVFLATQSSVNAGTQNSASGDFDGEGTMTLEELNLLSMQYLKAEEQKLTMDQYPVKFTEVGPMYYEVDQNRQNAYQQTSAENCGKLFVSDLMQGVLSPQDTNNKFHNKEQLAQTYRSNIGKPVAVRPLLGELESVGPKKVGVRDYVRMSQRTLSKDLDMEMIVDEEYETNHKKQMYSNDKANLRGLKPYVTSGLTRDILGVTMTGPASTKNSFGMQSTLQQTFQQVRQGMHHPRVSRRAAGSVPPRATITDSDIDILRKGDTIVNAKRWRRMKQDSSTLADKIQNITSPPKNHHSIANLWQSPKKFGLLTTTKKGGKAMSMAQSVYNSSSRQNIGTYTKQQTLDGDESTNMELVMNDVLHRPSILSPNQSKEYIVSSPSFTNFQFQMLQSPSSADDPPLPKGVILPQTFQNIEPHNRFQTLESGITLRQGATNTLSRKTSLTQIKESVINQIESYRKTKFHRDEHTFKPDLHSLNKKLITETDSKLSSFKLDGLKTVKEVILPKVKCFRPPPTEEEKRLKAERLKRKIQKGPSGNEIIESNKKRKGGSAALLLELKNKMDEQSESQRTTGREVPKEGEKPDDCTKNMVRFYEEYYRKNGVNNAIQDIPRMKAHNGVNSQKFPLPLQQKTQILDRVIQDTKALSLVTQRLVSNVVQESRQLKQVNKNAILDVMRQIMTADKVASLLGLSQKGLLVKRETDDWIKKHQQKGLKGVNEIELARAIFKAWDFQEKGYLSIQEITEQLTTMGLATEPSFVQSLLQQLKVKKVEGKSDLKEGQPIVEPPVNYELMTLKDFLGVFKPNRFGEKACQLISEQFQVEMTRQYRLKQYKDHCNKCTESYTKHLRENSAESGKSLKIDPGKQGWETDTLGTSPSVILLQDVKNDLPQHILQNESQFQSMPTSEPLSPTKMTNQGTKEVQRSGQKNNTNNLERRPTLPERMQVVEEWFLECAKRSYEVEAKKMGFEPEKNGYVPEFVFMSTIAEFIAEKGLASDRETALKQIQQALKLNDRVGKMNLAQFSKIFIRSLFKESLMDVLSDIETGIIALLSGARTKHKNLENNYRDKHLSLEIGTYQRKLMMTGVNNQKTIGEESANDIKDNKIQAMAGNIVSSMKIMRMTAGQNKNAKQTKKMTMDEFLADPEGIEHRRKQVSTNPAVLQARNNELLNAKIMKKVLETGNFKASPEQLRLIEASTESAEQSKR